MQAVDLQLSQFLYDQIQLMKTCLKKAIANNKKQVIIGTMQSFIDSTEKALDERSRMYGLDRTALKKLREVVSVLKEKRISDEDAVDFLKMLYKQFEDV